MLTTIKIRIYPTPEQAEYINRQIGCCRSFYNDILEYRIKYYEEHKSKPSGKEESAYIQQLKNEKPWYREVHSHPLQQSIRDLDTAYRNFFNGLKKGLKVGFPLYKSKHDTSGWCCHFRKDSFRYVRGNRISIIKPLSDILYKCSRRDMRLLNRFQGNVHSTTIRRTPSGKYYIMVLLDIPEPNKKPQTGCVVGLDLGLKDSVITSDGVTYNIKEETRIIEYEKKVIKKQRQMSKKAKGSKRYEKARKQYAKASEKVANVRENFHNQLVNVLVTENQIICTEDLNVKGMLKNHKLARSISRQGWCSFLTKLEHKCMCEDRQMVKVGRFYASSKTCGNCEYKTDKLPLDIREWTCPVCGTHHDRDINAANNILSEGLRTIGLSSPEFTHVDCPPVDDRPETDLKNSDRLNREKKVNHFSILH